MLRVVQPSSDGVAIRYVFPVLWMTSCFHTMCTVAVRVAEAPSSLRHFLVVEDMNITANVSWNAPLSDLPIATYQVNWSQLNAFNRRSLTVPKVYFIHLLAKCTALFTS